MSTSAYIQVTCAIIEHDGRILAVQRSETMARPLKWEFPGGKIRSGETPEVCAQREIREELDLIVEPLSVLPSARHRYSDIAIELVPVLCRLVGGALRLHEHKAARWLAPGELNGMEWSDADIPVAQQYLETGCHQIPQALERPTPPAIDTQESPSSAGNKENAES